MAGRGTMRCSLPRLASESSMLWLWAVNCANRGSWRGGGAAGRLWPQHELLLPTRSGPIIYT